MRETPIFASIKSAGMTSAQPLKEAFTKMGKPRASSDLSFRRYRGQGVLSYMGQNEGALALAEGAHLAVSKKNSAIEASQTR
jgi:hypothetical protein